MIKSHGGPRQPTNKPGTRKKMGRPRSGKFTHSVFVTDAEWAKVQKFIALERASR